MAQIITYPKLSTLANNDLLIVSDVSSVNKTTNSLELQTLADFIITSTSGITGSGTLNTIAMFTPTGVEIGDSIITQSSGPTKITVGGSVDVGVNLSVAGDSSVVGTFIGNDIEIYGLARFLANSEFSGNVQILNTSSQFSCQAPSFFTKDVVIAPLFGGPAPNLIVNQGNIDLSNFGRVIQMLDPVDPQDAATKAYADTKVDGTGTTNTLPLWSDGPNGVLSNSLITQASLGQAITVNTNLFVSDDLNVTGSAEVISNLTVNGTTTTVGDVSIGANTITNTPGWASIAAGDGNTVLNIASSAFGINNTANAVVAFAGGGGSQTNGIAAIAYGNNVQANGVNSVAFGNITTASGDQSFAVGDLSTASGQNSMALGGDALAQDSLAGPGVTVNTADYAGFKNLLLANYASLNYTSDAAAAAGGVPLGGIYHNAGDVKIRLV